MKLMNGMNVRPIGTFVYARKCFNDHIRDESGNVLLYLDDNSADGNPLGTGTWAEIIGVGPDCEHFHPDNVGCFCLLPEMINGMYRLGSLRDGSEDFAIKESALLQHFAAIATEES
jgi:hypothetical protein